MSVKAKLERKLRKLEAKKKILDYHNHINGKHKLKAVGLNQGSKFEARKIEPFVCYSQYSWRILKNKGGISESVKFLKFANSEDKPFEHLTLKGIESVEYIFG